MIVCAPSSHANVVHFFSPSIHFEDVMTTSSLLSRPSCIPRISFRAASPRRCLLKNVYEYVNYYHECHVRRVSTARRQPSRRHRMRRHGAAPGPATRYACTRPAAGDRSMLPPAQAARAGPSCWRRQGFSAQVVRTHFTTMLAHMKIAHAVCALLRCPTYTACYCCACCEGTSRQEQGPPCGFRHGRSERGREDHRTLSEGIQYPSRHERLVVVPVSAHTPLH